MRPLIGGTLNIKHVRAHWDDILRLASSIKQGTVTASLMLRKLGSYPHRVVQAEAPQRPLLLVVAIVDEGLPVGQLFGGQLGFQIVGQFARPERDSADALLPCPLRFGVVGVAQQRDGRGDGDAPELFALAQSDGDLHVFFFSVWTRFQIMGRYLPEIAWETEVWVADAPSHLIHFNGVRFLGPYPTE